MRSGRVVNFVLIFNICAIRYNEFHDVYEKLKKAYPSEASSIKFPGKRIIGNNFDPDFIKLRREALHDFTIRLMKVGVAISIETTNVVLSGRHVSPHSYTWGPEGGGLYYRGLYYSGRLPPPPPSSLCGTCTYMQCQCV